MTGCFGDEQGRSTSCRQPTCAPVAFIASIILSERKYDSMDAAGPMQIASSHICKHQGQSQAAKNLIDAWGGNIARQNGEKRQAY